MSKSIQSQAESDVSNWQGWAKAVEHLESLKSRMISLQLQYDIKKRLQMYGMLSSQELLQAKEKWVRSINTYVTFKRNNPGVIL